MPGARPAPDTLSRGTLVFAGPDYDLKAEQREVQARQVLGDKLLGDRQARRGAPLDGTRGLRWAPLPGAAAEADDVKRTLQGTRFAPVRTFVGPQALEEVFKAMPTPRLLHLATHGFFLPEPKTEAAAPETAADAGPSAESATGGLARFRKMRNPLLRSGIVLAGANSVVDNSTGTRVDDGWVNAQEIALLNLRGTELVVLSACESGLGDLRAGQGVYGLRHAFLYAGARSLLTSLFEVPDVETRDMMRRFYENLATNGNKLAALHDAQLGMIRQRRKEHEAAHPFYWASFVLVGDSN